MPSLEMNMLEGLMSRCMMRRSCMWLSAAQMFVNIPQISVSENAAPVRCRSFSNDPRSPPRAHSSTITSSFSCTNESRYLMMWSCSSARSMLTSLMQSMRSFESRISKTCTVFSATGCPAARCQAAYTVENFPVPIFPSIRNSLSERPFCSSAEVRLELRATIEKEAT